MNCSWSDGSACPFVELESTVEQFEGRSYCLAHLPAAAKGNNSVEWVQKFIAEREARGQYDFRGLVFVAPPKGPATYIMSTGNYDCRNADLQVQVIIETTKANKADFSGSVFRGRNHLRGRWKVLQARDCKFEGEFHCRFDSGTGSIDFSGSRFGSKAKFEKVGDLSQLSLDGCDFHRAPAILDEKIPQQTTFSGAKFRKNALARQDEGRYRHIRNLFSENRARESEGQFYALEKRSHRRSLSWQSAWFARSISWLYDISSAYGQSYERAFFAFVLVQIVFGFGYSIAAGRFVLGGPIDAEAVSFTLSQVAKPFELLSGRDPSAAAYSAIVGAGSYSTGWAFWTFIHSVLSLTLAALFLLAVRWRFRRE